MVNDYDAARGRLDDLITDTLKRTGPATVRMIAANADYRTHPHVALGMISRRVKELHAAGRLRVVPGRNRKEVRFALPDKPRDALLDAMQAMPVPIWCTRIVVEIPEPDDADTYGDEWVVTLTGHGRKVTGAVPVGQGPMAAILAGVRHAMLAELKDGER